MRALASVSYPEYTKQLDEAVNEAGARKYAPSQKELVDLVANNEALLDKWLSETSRKVNDDFGDKASARHGEVDEVTGLNRKKLRDLSELIYKKIVQVPSDSEFGELLTKLYPSFYRSEPGQKYLVLQGGLDKKLIGEGAPYARTSMGFRDLVLRAILGELASDPSGNTITENGKSIFDYFAYGGNRFVRDMHRALRDRVLYNLAGNPPVKFDKEKGVYVYDPSVTGFNASRWLEPLGDKLT